MTTIVLPSVQSLFIQMYFNGQVLSSGTAFVVTSGKGTPLLITNRHNVTGRNQETEQPISPTGGIPNKLIIRHNAKGDGITWIDCSEPLYDSNNNPLWHEHSTLGAKADFVALKLTQLNDVKLYPYDVSDAQSNIEIGTADIVSVIGFPFGKTAGGSLGIWATGFVASDPDINYDNLPVFLIDCRSRQGQSGSPVIAWRGNGMSMGSGGKITVNHNGPLQKFLGIYSGRINAESDLGIVWKRTAIKELVDTI